MIKKTVIIAAIFAFAVLPLFGSGGDEEGAALDDIGFHAGGFPVVDETVTIKVVWQKWASHVKEPTEMIVPSQGNKEMNINVEWTAVTAEAWTEKINLMLASGDLPDTFAAPLTDFNVISQAEAGAFIPMQDLIDKYAPNIKGILADRSALKSWITAPDGNIYSLFKIFEGSWMPISPILNIQKKWMEKMGLGKDDMPNSLDEYFDLLMMAKNAGDLNGNGEADEIPFGFVYEGNSRGLAHFFYAHGLPIVPGGEGGNRNYTMVEDGKVIYAPTTEAFKDSMKAMNKFWSAGLMDIEGFSQTGGQFSGKGKQDQYFSFPDWWVQNWVPAERWDDYVYATNIAAEGYEYKTHYRTAYNRGIAPITSAAEHPEVVMRWIDYWYETIKAIEVTEGPIGVRLEPHDDGTYTVKKTPEGLGLSEWRDSETLGPGGITSITKETYKNIFIFTQAEWCGTVKNDYYGPYWPEEWWPSPVMSSSQIKEEQALLPDIEALVSKTVAKWITEGVDDDEWDQFQNQLQTIGLPKLLEMWQKNYDLFLANAGGKMVRPYDKGTGDPYPGGWGHEPGSRL